jgi:hypothetical protein
MNAFGRREHLSQGLWCKLVVLKGGVSRSFAWITNMRRTVPLYGQPTLPYRSVSPHPHLAASVTFLLSNSSTYPKFQYDPTTLNVPN